MKLIYLSRMVTIINSNSSGRRENGGKNRVEVLSGPLKGKEGRIARVNLHRREAVIRIDFMGRETEIFLGIETIGDKSPQKELKK